MPITRYETVPVRAEPHVVLVRQLVRKGALDLKFSLVDQTRIVTAASEPARNTLIYGGGSKRIESVGAGARSGLRLVFEDQGPGIPDLDLALKDGYTTGVGLRLGLSGSKRLMNEFELVSAVGQGTGSPSPAGNEPSGSES